MHNVLRRHRAIQGSRRTQFSSQYDLQALQGNATAHLWQTLSGYPLSDVNKTQAYPDGTGTPEVDISALPAHCQYVGVSCCASRGSNMSSPYYISGNRACSWWPDSLMCAGFSTLTECCHDLLQRMLPGKKLALVAATMNVVSLDTCLQQMEAAISRL